MKHDRIMIIDYGSQYTQLITRRIRELNVYAEIFPFDVNENDIADFTGTTLGIADLNNYIINGK